MYDYRATVIRWVDGDTVDLIVDLGFTVQVIQRFRLIGINTPETNRKATRPEGLAAKEYAMQAAPEGSAVMVQSYKTGKYGRWLGEVFPLIEGEPAESVNQQLLAAGHAEVYP